MTPHRLRIPFLILALFFFTRAQIAFVVPPPVYSGTLVAYFVTRDEIHLFSDGRAIDHGSGVVHDDWSKVHRINDRVGMLEGGIYIPGLHAAIVRECRKNATTSAPDVADCASRIMQRAVRHLRENSVDAAALGEARFYAIIAGFDHRDRPRVFFIDSQSNPPFAPQDQALNLTHGRIAIGAISTHSGAGEAPTRLLNEAFSANEKEHPDSAPELSTIANAAFNETKEALAETEPTIGGETFLESFAVKASLPVRAKSD